MLVKLMKYRCCGAEVIYFAFSSEMENRTLAQMRPPYDVSSLFTFIPVTSAIDIMRNKLEQDKEIPKRTTMPANNTLELLEFCLCNTYFLLQGQFYEQTKGVAMGSAVSPTVAYLYMESFEHRVIISAVNPPMIWKRYVDDTFVILQQLHKKKNSCNILILWILPSYSPQKKLDLMVPCHSWTHNTTERWNPNNQCI